MNFTPKKQTWPTKFRIAFSGLLYAFKVQTSFNIHLPCAAVVVGLAIYLQLDSISFGLLLLCIGAVITAELFNTSLEYLARAITDQADDHVRLALDVASGAVLAISLVAAIVGLMVLVPGIYQWL